MGSREQNRIWRLESEQYSNNVHGASVCAPLARVTSPARGHYTKVRRLSGI